MNLFSSEGKLLHWLGRFTDLVTLNLLWLMCSLPVFTVGASTAALYHLTLKLACREDGSITRRFFAAFRENFWQATAVWLLSLGTVLLIFCDFFIITNLAGGNLTALLFPMLAVLILLWGCSCYFYPVIAYFRNTTRKVLTNSFRLCCGHLLNTLVLMSLSLLPMLVLYASAENPALGSFLLLIIAFSGTAYLQSMVLLRLFHDL